MSREPKAEQAPVDIYGLTMLTSNSCLFSSARIMDITPLILIKLEGAGEVEENRVWCLQNGVAEGPDCAAQSDWPPPALHLPRSFSFPPLFSTVILFSFFIQLLY